MSPACASGVPVTPRFTPDKQEDDDDDAQRQVIESFAVEVDDLVAADDPESIDLIALARPRRRRRAGGRRPPRARRSPPRA